MVYAIINYSICHNSAFCSFRYTIMLSISTVYYSYFFQATALDKASRYFEGRKQQLTLPDDEKSQGEEDEIF